MLAKVRFLKAKNVKHWTLIEWYEGLFLCYFVLFGLIEYFCLTRIHKTWRSVRRSLDYRIETALVHADIFAFKRTEYKVVVQTKYTVQ